MHDKPRRARLLQGIWNLTHRRPLTFCLSSSAVVHTENYWRPSTGIGQVQGLATALESLALAYGEINYDVVLSDDEIGEKRQGDLVILGSPKTNIEAWHFLQNFQEILKWSVIDRHGVGLEYINIESEQRPLDPPTVVRLHDLKGAPLQTRPQARPKAPGSAQSSARFGQKIKLDTGIPIRLEGDDDDVCLVRRYDRGAASYAIVLQCGGDSSRTIFASTKEGDDVTKDYGLIIRCPSPYSRGETMAFLFAGNHTWGTSAAVRWYCKQKEKEMAQWADRSTAVVTVIECGVLNNHYTTIKRVQDYSFDTSGYKW